jgi:hypothetical protein
MRQIVGISERKTGTRWRPDQGGWHEADPWCSKISRARPPLFFEETSRPHATIHHPIGPAARASQQVA